MCRDKFRGGREAAPPPPFTHQGNVKLVFLVNFFSFSHCGSVQFAWIPKPKPASRPKFSCIWHLNLLKETEYVFCIVMVFAICKYVSTEVFNWHSGFSPQNKAVCPLDARHMYWDSSPACWGWRRASGVQFFHRHLVQSCHHRPCYYFVQKCAEHSGNVE